MRWTRLVVRPDALLRFWCIGGLELGPAYASASSADVFADATFTSHIFLNDGSTHVRVDELDDLYQRFTAAAAADPSTPQQLAKHFVRLGERWVADCDDLNEVAALRDLTDDGLAERLMRFCDSYSNYAPALYLPFPVERLYAEKFPFLLAGVARALREALQAGLHRHPDLGPFAAAGIVSLAEENEISRLIRRALEHAPERTNAEQKDLALNRLATGLLEQFGGGALPQTPEELVAKSPSLAYELDEVVSAFAWIGQWGYPPRYSASTPNDLLGEALIRVERLRQSSAPGDPSVDQDFGHRILDMARTSERDRALLADFAYYNYYRTYRMELLIRAQYLSVPLLDEVGVRLGLHSREWTQLTPEEMAGALMSRTEREDLGEVVSRRAAGWMLETDGLRRARTLRDSAEYRRGLASFRGVLFAGENARSSSDATDPAVVGGKAASLARLLAAGFPVPDFAVLTTEGAALLEDSTVGTTVRNTLRSAAASVTGGQRLAVRSSASVEDGSTYSWAGRFVSVLNVSLEDLDSAVKTVLTSAHSDRVAAYAERVARVSDEIAMAVILQAQVDADFAGAMNTTILSEGRRAIEIELVEGLGDKLLDGSCTPARYLVFEDGGIVISGAPIPVPERLVATIAGLGRAIESHFGGPQDVEFAVQGETVFIVQARPLTGASVAMEVESAQEALLDPNVVEVVSGLCGHVSRRVEGDIAKPTAPASGLHLAPESVLVLSAATPIWDSVILQAIALVTNEGGSTSHAIRVANELSIPAVVGTRVATKLLGVGERVIVDTTGATSVGRVLRRRTQ